VLEVPSVATLVHVVVFFGVEPISSFVESTLVTFIFATALVSSWWIHLWVPLERVALIVSKQFFQVAPAVVFLPKRTGLLSLWKFPILSIGWLDILAVEGRVVV